MPAILILMYHHVNPEGTALNVRPDLFEEQIRYLSEKGYRTVGVRELIEMLEGDSMTAGKHVMLTFDDGWLDNWFYAWPVLEKYSMKAVIFVVTSWILETEHRKNPFVLPRHRECMERIREGKTDDLIISWSGIREMHSSGLIEIGSHTHTHQRWADGDRVLSRAEHLKTELRTSKDMIEKMLGTTCDALCWPWGDYDKESVRIASEEGYRALFTTEKGTNSTADDLSGLKRIVIGNIGLSSFRKKLFIHGNPILSRLYMRLFH